ncbi:MAG TPA: hypothetical protein ACN46Y_00540 [Prochlorococcus sp.]
MVLWDLLVFVPLGLLASLEQQPLHLVEFLRLTPGVVVFEVVGLSQSCNR